MSPKREQLRSIEFVSRDDRVPIIASRAVKALEEDRAVKKCMTCRPDRRGDVDSHMDVAHATEEFGRVNAPALFVVFSDRVRRLWRLKWIVPSGKIEHVDVRRQRDDGMKLMTGEFNAYSPSPSGRGSG